MSKEADELMIKVLDGRPLLEVFPMDGNSTECPRCSLEFKSLLHPFCQHKDCPPREYKKAKIAASSNGIPPNFESSEIGFLPYSGDRHAGKIAESIKQQCQIKENFIARYLQETGAKISETQLVEQRLENRIVYWCEPKGTK